MKKCLQTYCVLINHRSRSLRKSFELISLAKFPAEPQTPANRKFLGTICYIALTIYI